MTPGSAYTPTMSVLSKPAEPTHAGDGQERTLTMSRHRCPHCKRKIQQGGADRLCDRCYSDRQKLVADILAAVKPLEDEGHVVTRE